MVVVKSEESGVREEASNARELKATQTFTLAHLSDPHLSSPREAPLRAFLNKRISGYLSWRLHRRAEHRAEVLAALVRDIESTNPDHIAITGDLTHLGLPSEFQAARKWLHSLGPASTVTVIPGNHDAYVGTDWQGTFALWADYMCSDGAVADWDFETAFPLLRVRRQVALIGVSTARPSPPFFAVGRVGQAQSKRLETILADAGEQGLLRIVLIHHPPVPGVIAWRKRLTDGERFRSVVAAQGAELVLHGHGHRTSLTEIDTPAGRVTAIGVPSASALGRKPGRRARYHVCRLTRNALGWDVLVSVRRYSVAEDCFVQEDEFRLAVNRPTPHF